MNRNVVVGERRIHDPPVRSSNSVSSVSASPRPMIIPPRNWLAAVFGIEDACRSRRAEQPIDADFACHIAHAKLAEDRRLNSASNI